jgi:hypothetical protein
MKKLLVGLFLVLILGIGVFGYNHSDPAGEVVEQNNYSAAIE